MIILYKNGTGIYSKLQHWFSGQPYNHSAIYLGLLLDRDWVYEAGFSLSANPVNLKDKNIEVWHCDIDLYESLIKYIDKVAGKPYAFLQILYFVRRKLYESIPFAWKIVKLFHKAKTPKKLNNWFPRSMICTEFVYEVIKEASYTENRELYRYLVDNYNSNNLYVSDLADIFKKFPNIFHKRERG